MTSSSGNCLDGYAGRRALRHRGPHRRCSSDLNAMHHATEARVIVDSEMLHAAVIPHSQCTLAIAEAAGEVGTADVIVEELEQGLALLLGHILEAQTIDTRFPDELAPGVGMHAHQRMLHLLLGILDEV